MVCILPLGDEPGLKSDAMATGKPASIIFLTGDSCILRKKAAPGKTVGMVLEFSRHSISSSPTNSKWSHDRALCFTATCIPPE